MELFLLMCATMKVRDIMGRLIAARKHLGLSQTDVATQLNITQVQYSKYESGKSDLSLTKFLELLRILEIDISSFSDEINKSKEELLQFIEKQEGDLRALKKKIK